MSVSCDDRKDFERQIGQSGFAQKLMATLHSEASDLMQESTRIDRWLTLDQDGQMYFTTRNISQPQTEVKYCESYDPESNDAEEEVLGWLLNAVTDLLVEREYELLTLEDNRPLRTATPEEVLESWMSSPGGAISTSEGTCYVAFGR